MIQELIYALRFEEFKSHVRMDNEYYVIDLVRCSLKRNFEIKYPNLVVSSIYDPALITGSIVHYGIAGLLKYAREKGIINWRKVEFEVDGVKRLSFDSNSNLPYIAAIKGRADIIIVDEDDNRVGVEIKFSRNGGSLPYQHHIDQVKAYNWLFNLDYSILLYITPDRITEYTIRDRFSDEQIADLIRKPKTPRYPWECRYCLFNILCPKYQSSR